MPSSIIGGLFCLFTGWQFLDILPFSVDESKIPNFISYPSLLVVILFSTLFLGKHTNSIHIKKTIKDVGDTFFLNAASLVGQYGFSLLFGFLILKPIFPELPSGFGLFLPAGFIGGHGTAAAIGIIFEEGGLPGALTIAYASATVGILVGIFGGILLVNIGTRKGWTRVVTSIQKMPKSMRTGFLSSKERTFLGKETISPIALDSFTWHIALVLSATVLAFFTNNVINNFISGNLSIPIFCLALLWGSVIQKFFNFIGIGVYIDRKIIHRIGSLVTDYLVVFGIASITLHVVANFAFPLIFMFFFGTLFTISLMFFVGSKISQNFWFERSLVMYGWNTGSVATSIVLLRVIDPDMKTSIMEDFGLVYIFISIIEIFIITLLPPLVLSNIILIPSLFLITLFFSFIFASKKIIGWFNQDLTTFRNKEFLIIQKLNKKNT